MFKVLASIFFMLMLAAPIIADESRTDVSIVSSGSSVNGLELPNDQKVNFDEGFVNLQAKCKGEVRWLVVAPVKVKYITVQQNNSIIVSIPPVKNPEWTDNNPLKISVFAIALVDSKLTEFANTTITVIPSGPTPPGPTPPGPTPPGPTSSNLHLTVFVEMNGTTPELAVLLNSESLRTGVINQGHRFRIYDIKDPIITEKKFDNIIKQVGGNNVLVIQNTQGKILFAQAVPKTEQDIFNIIKQITGK